MALENYKLYLDDIRMPKTEGWVIVRSVEEFQLLITEAGLPREMSLDHDLGENVPDGYDAVKWMVNEKEFNLTEVDINIHSANPVGMQNMRSLIDNWNKIKE